MIVLSQELFAISADLLQRRTPLSAEDANATGDLINHLANLAWLQERELEIHRLREHSRINSQTIKQLLDTHTSEILRLHREKVAEDKVIRPDFSKGGRS